MRYKIDNCHYELVKDLLSSLDSLVKNVEKDDQGAIVTLQDGNECIESRSSTYIYTRISCDYLVRSFVLLFL